MLVIFLYFFGHISSYAHRSHKRYIRTAREEGRPDTVWTRSVQCVARGMPSKYFFRREWIRQFPGFSFRGVISYQVSSIFLNVGVYAHTYLFENGAACHNSGFPVQGQAWGTPSSKFGRVCRVSRGHVPWIMRFLFSSIKKRPPVQRAWVQL